MLREVGNVYPQDPGTRRRWFCDDYFDLFVWEVSGGDIAGFQLCYDMPARERVLNWRKDAGYTHHRIDSGEQSLFKNMTPIMVADGVLPLPVVLEKFDKHAAVIEPRIRQFIRQRLLDYGARLDNPITGE